MASKVIANGNVRRGIYVPQELEHALEDYARRHSMSFNEAIRTAGLSLLELERRGVTIRQAGIAFEGLADAEHYHTPRSA